MVSIDAVTRKITNRTRDNISRSDAIGNIAVMFAAGGVFALGSAWPDIIVAATLAWLALSAAWQIVRTARKELIT